MNAVFKQFSDRTLSIKSAVIPKNLSEQVLVAVPMSDIESADIQHDN